MERIQLEETMFRNEFIQLSVYFWLVSKIIWNDHKMNENDQHMHVEFKWKMLNIDLSMVEKEEQYIIGRVTNDQTFKIAWFRV